MNFSRYSQYLKIFFFFCNILFLLTIGLLISISPIPDPLNPFQISSFMQMVIIIIIFTTQLTVIVQLAHAHYIGNNEYVGNDYVRIWRFLIETQHHPNCSCYNDHEFTYQDMRICSGCYGTIFGLIIGMSILFVYFFLKEFFFPDFWMIVFISGILIIQIHFLKYLFYVKKTKFRFFLNSTLPIGLNIIIISFLIINPDNLVFILVLFAFIPEIGLRLLFSYLDHEDISCPHFTNNPS